MISMQSSTTEQNVPWNLLLGLNAFFSQGFERVKQRDAGKEKVSINNSYALPHTLKQTLAGSVSHLAL